MITKAPRERERRSIAPITIPTRAPMLRVTDPLEEEVEPVILTVIPSVEDEVAAASPILLVNVLAKVLVRVVV